MGHIMNFTAGLRGLSFSIADLLLISGWAEAMGLHTDIQLDHGSEFEEYEEVVRFRSNDGRSRRLIMWRDAEAVFVQPLPGRIKRHASVAEALDGLAPRDTVIMTDVMPAGWP